MSDDVVFFRKFNKFNPDSNNNKTWQVTHYRDGSTRVEWGANDGRKLQGKTLQEPLYLIEKRIQKQLSEGYVEVPLRQADRMVTITDGQPPAEINPRVYSLFKMLAVETAQYIQKTTPTTVDMLSYDQIDKGLMLLLKIERARSSVERKDYITDYLRQIPTAVPRTARRGIDMDHVSAWFDVANEENRLRTLRQAVATINITSTDDPVMKAYLATGAKITPMDTNDPDRKQIEQYVYNTLNVKHKNSSVNHVRVQDVLWVHIPHERQAYLNETRGKTFVNQLFHGTHLKWGLDILKSGLIVPETESNGRRCGHGIYFADHSLRAWRYSDQNNIQHPAMLLLSDVALGKSYQITTQNRSLRKPPQGYDSVQGTLSYGGMDEWVVYKPSQATIRAIILMTRHAGE